MTIHETAAKLSAVNARIADMAQTSTDECLRLATRIQELERSLAQALRYIQVSNAYRGSMTAAEVEARILADMPTLAEVQIGANSCNTLAKFDLFAARAILAKGN